jgi:hypothetical protein
MRRRHGVAGIDASAERGLRDPERANGRPLKTQKSQFLYQEMSDFLSGNVRQLQNLEDCLFS